MNILPKKRWHVRTKDNIARVRRDEAEAREKERERQEKLEFAESEARINFLRKKSGAPEKFSGNNAIKKDESATTSSAANQLPTNESGHVDLFSDFKTHIKTTNKELEKEKKEEQEKYEKQIGYLTYLGQDTNEALKLRSWYEVAPKRAIVGQAAIEKDLKAKHSNDPLTLINALLPPEKKPLVSVSRKRKHSTSLSTTEPVSQLERKRVKTSSEECSISNIKKHKKEKKEKKSKREKHHKKSKKHKEKKRMKAAEREKEIEREKQEKREKLEQLRKERIRREAHERSRQEALLAPKVPQESATKSAATTPRIVQKYNSQFNPELAKQNML